MNGENKMQKKQEWLKFVIPVVAVLIIAESVLVVSGLDKKKTVANVVPEKKAIVSEESDALLPEEDALLHFVFETDKDTLLVGEENKVGVSLVTETDVSLDSLELYVEYDPDVFDVSDLDYGDSLPKPAFMKVSEDKGLVVANFMISEANGLPLADGDVMKVLDFVVTGKQTGEYKFSISTGGVSEGSVTMLVENASQGLVPFSSDELVIRITE